MKLKVNDQVLVTAGKDKGRKGKIDRLLPSQSAVLVKGINQYKRHVKSRGKDQPGGIITLDRPLPVANVALICPQCKHVTRVGYQVSKSGQKHRICKKCQGALS